MDPHFIKTGDTYSCLGEYREFGVPVDITNYSVSAIIKSRNGTVLGTLAVTMLTQANATLGKFMMTTLVGADWTLGDARFDVRVNGPDGSRRSSRTVILRIDEGITP